jgi:hypothetical protein
MTERGGNSWLCAGRVAFWHGLRGRLDKLANRFGVLRVCRRLHRAI